MRQNAISQKAPNTEFTERLRQPHRVAVDFGFYVPVNNKIFRYNLKLKTQF
jgi:hypothetical protein